MFTHHPEQSVASVAHDTTLDEPEPVVATVLVGPPDELTVSPLVVAEVDPIGAPPMPLPPEPFPPPPSPDWIPLAAEVVSIVLPPPDPLSDVDVVGVCPDALLDSEAVWDDAPVPAVWLAALDVLVGWFVLHA